MPNLLHSNLERNGYIVDQVHDGREGLEKILKDQPDLVILDLMLPGLDGYKILKKMQRDTRSNSIPVLMLTAKSQIDDRLKGLTLLLGRSTDHTRCHTASHHTLHNHLEKKKKKKKKALSVGLQE